MGLLLAYLTLAVTLIAFLYGAWRKSHTDLRIIRAIYGKNDLTRDITKNLNHKIKNNKLSIQLSNEIAGDPAKNEVKIARIKYWHKGKRYNREYIEGETIDLP